MAPARAYGSEIMIERAHVADGKGVTSTSRAA
jgi:hypothetical protein